MDTMPGDIVEQLLDPLMFGELVDGHPAAAITRTAANQVRLDLGGDGRSSFTITVEPIVGDQSSA